jgi:hypothetical protein
MFMNSLNANDSGKKPRREEVVREAIQKVLKKVPDQKKGFYDKVNDITVIKIRLIS